MREAVSQSDLSHIKIPRPGSPDSAEEAGPALPSLHTKCPWGEAFGSSGCQSGCKLLVSQTCS